jgi:hypothetical protein
MPLVGWIFTPDESVYLERNVRVINSQDVRITNVDWYKSNTPNHRVLDAISCFNNTDIHINYVEVLYQVFTPSGNPIDSRVLKLGTEIPISPKSAKKLSDEVKLTGATPLYYGLYLDEINNSDKVLLVVKTYDY